MCSAQALNNMSFKYAGELMAMSIAHGGPSPSFLKEWVFDYVANGISSVKPDVDDVKSPEHKSFIHQVHDV